MGTLALCCVDLGRVSLGGLIGSLSISIDGWEFMGDLLGRLI